MVMESSQELETILNHSRDAFLLADNEGKILFFNSAIEELSGFSLKKYLGKNLKLLVNKGLISYSTALEAIDKKQTITGKIETYKGKKQLVTSVPVINRSGGLDRIVCNIRGLSIIQEKLMQNSLNTADLDAIKLKEKTINYGINKFYHLIEFEGCDDGLVYKDRSMEELVDLAVKLGRVESTVLIYGETGSGKELIAQLIHNCSSRALSGPFIKVNCASIPVSLIESELFGYEHGSFTGALKQGKKGYFELAHKGTLLLDEIAELPLEVQAKLLRALQDKRINRIGDSKSVAVDVRIIAATNRNLEQMVKEGRFREDLYFRLNVVPVEVPPLRNRLSEIPALFHFFTEKISNKYGIFNIRILDEVIEHLLGYPWPGNVRELANLVERLIVTSSSNTIRLSNLCEPYRSCTSRLNKEKFSIYGLYPLKEIVNEFELAVVKKALEQSKTYAEATKKLDISLSSLMRKIKKIKHNQM